MHRSIRLLLVACSAALLAPPTALYAGESRPVSINPCPRQVLRTERLQQWSFRNDAAGWRAIHDCTLATADGAMTIRSSGIDPYLMSPLLRIPGPITVRLRAKCGIAGKGQIFWTTTAFPQTDEMRSEHFTLIHDDRWHDYLVPLHAEGTVTGVRLDPGEAPGVFQLERMELVREILHPLELQSVRTDGRRVTLSVENHAAKAMSFAVGGQEITVAGGATNSVSFTAGGHARFEPIEVALRPAGLPPICRSVFIVDDGAAADWVTRQTKFLTLQVARDASGGHSNTRFHEAVSYPARRADLGVPAAYAGRPRLGLPRASLCSRLRVDRRTGLPGPRPRLGHYGLPFHLPVELPISGSSSRAFSRSSSASSAWPMLR
jgi:hypothetical protein